MESEVKSFADLKNEVLRWLESMRITSCQYKMDEHSDSSIFTTCFALFILDLFSETNKFTEKEKQNWITYIQCFQNKKHGYFEPETYFHADKERNCYQLTCFCLSALKILNTNPRWPLTFVDEIWPTKEDIKKYLYERGCHEGCRGSGNKAMFLGIFLTYEYERTSRKDLLEKLNAWFDFHNKTQNPQSGFWGNAKSTYYYRGMQNALHQFEIYYYWKRPINYIEEVVNNTLKIQNRDGSFSPIPGGEGCHDYDAIHILANSYLKKDYKREEIAASLHKATKAIIQNKNGDGGFCQAKRTPKNFIDLFKMLRQFFFGLEPYIWAQRLKASVAAVLMKKTENHTGWVKSTRKVDRSNLWDTWFRCLSLAEIAQTLNDCNNSSNEQKIRFHKMIGLGNFDNQF